MSLAERGPSDAPFQPREDDLAGDGERAVQLFIRKRSAGKVQMLAGAAQLARSWPSMRSGAIEVHIALSGRWRSRRTRTKPDVETNPVRESNFLVTPTGACTAHVIAP